jgi:hypothetical protein
MIAARTWRASSQRGFLTGCPVALRLLDEFTGAGLIGDAELKLDFEDGASWRPSNVAVVRSAGGMYVYPGLGRHADPTSVPSVRVRVRIVAEFYRPAYAADAAGLEYLVPTYNDTTPPAFVPVMPESVFLLPASNYPFPGHVRVLRGTVRRSSDSTALADARVSAGVERVLTDERGAFSLPLRWQALSGPVAVLAEHLGTGLSNTVNVPLPAALATNQDILVT